MISMSKVDVSFNLGSPLENHVLKGIDLTIPKHQFITVIGSNGAGKSTLLNALSGEVAVQTGQIHLDDQDITKLPVHKRARWIARVFQDPLTGTCEDLTIEENLALAQARTSRRGLQRAARREFKQSFINKLKSLELGLEYRLEDKIGLLSGGQRQAVSLLMAALQPSKLLLLDEHTAALDPKTAKFILNLSEEIIRSEKLTALMVTHSMNQALSVGDRTLMLHQGQVVLDVSGKQREGMNSQDLLDQFHKNHDALDDDKLVLS
ncbi:MULTISPECIES: ABC transporter ATP-binding protein [unclassified Oleiphilus]|uniref:ABC transporter ATP-binding protein n=1 Tax=unclassified Oleiphilus TaxID=2631174 RepID=UPI0007C20DB1|nr:MULTISPECIES: ABC transporter ATP-binding protein [unclassified Oleiphilus]KZY42325.1 ABC transporter ATP-binding protein [Oleiphilus sp. HI0050]KZZ36074.1 ABC transporter ATP-binding protein [Oleiphilus sp. HI0086]KZZ37260.1 ABC transporter ATP-binding protein [Oleiphilus sp. HI0117]KZZ60867.1 ABC transporter ATP-binding protein [Oleiphilus sp. HI0123]